MFELGLLMVQLNEKLLVSTGWQSPSSSKDNYERLTLVAADQHSGLN
jgi:hypothetical protein